MTETQHGKEFLDTENPHGAAWEQAVKFTKQCRVDLDEILQKLQTADRKSRQRSLTMTKIEEAIMWLGKDLQDLNTPNPYPDSKDPTNTKIEPAADRFVPKE
jgi:hypothetical protein